MKTQGSAYSTMMSTTATTGGSTAKGIFSFSSRSVLSSTKGTPINERFKTSAFHLSVNMHRYQGFSKVWSNFTVVFRYIQIFALFLMPSYSKFWNSGSSSNVFVSILTLPIHFCLLPRNVYFHSLFSIVLFVLLVAATIFIFKYLFQNPNEKSVSNTIIFIYCFLIQVFFPITAIFCTSLFGNSLGLIVFEKNRDVLPIISCVCGALSTIISIFYHYFGLILHRCLRSLDFNLYLVPWPAFQSGYAHLELYYILLAFFEEFFPLNNKWYLIAYGALIIIINNPYSAYFVMRRSIFQRYGDEVMLSTIFIGGFIASVTLNISRFIPDFTPSLLFVILVLLTVVIYFILKYISDLTKAKYIKMLYSVYHDSKSILPSPTPQCLQVPVVGLSHEAYSVMQAFSSLEINSRIQFQKILSIGTQAATPAIKYNDFIKWGLNFFYDRDTLFMCAQICQFFGNDQQTQTVLIQVLRDAKFQHNINGQIVQIQEELPLLMRLKVSLLELDHSDVISDKPMFYKSLERKANGGLKRCRRALSLFWGCVLKHSSVAMRDATSRLIDAINEVDSHFDELLRCYPTNLDAISLQLAFLTEIKGEFIQTQTYINDMSSMFVELNANRIDDDSLTSIQVLLNDSSKSYSKYISKLSKYIQYERRIKEITRGPQKSLWILSIVSFITLLSCTIAVIVVTLTHFNTYPDKLKIVDEGNTAIVEIAGMIRACRYLCLHATGELNDTPKDFGDGSIDANVYDTSSQIYNYLVEETATLAHELNQFFTDAAAESTLLSALIEDKRKISVYNTVQEQSLWYLINIMMDAITSITVNIPKYFKDDAFDNSQLLYDVSEYTAVCKSAEMGILFRNIENICMFTENFIAKFIDMSNNLINQLDKMLYWMMIFLPVSFIVFFGLWLLFTTVYILNEEKFRCTLFFSLPEKVASTNFKKSSDQKKKRKETAKNKNPAFSVTEIARQMNKQNHPAAPAPSDDASALSPEQQAYRDRAMVVESLAQFSNASSQNYSFFTKFVVWVLVYIVFTATALFVLIFYSRKVNSTFHDRSLMLCKSSTRYSLLQYSTLFIQEGLIDDTMRFNTNDEVYQLGSLFLENATNDHIDLTYGSDEIQFDFREYKGIANLMLGENFTYLDKYTVMESEEMISHPGYRYLGLDAVTWLIVAANKAIYEKFKEDPTIYSIDSTLWKQFSHLFVNHVSPNLMKSSSIYLSGVNDTISDGFLIALVISLVALFAIIALILGPILQYVLRISKYFSMNMHILGQVPHEMIRHTSYISRWFEGEINRTNYKRQEALYSRSVSQSVQSQVIEEIKETMIIYDLEGEFVTSSSDTIRNLQDNSLKAVVEMFSDSEKTFQSIFHAMATFQSAKESINTVTINTVSVDGKPLRISVGGVESNNQSFQRYYSFISIMIKNIEDEAHIEEEYFKAKAHTRALLKRLFPKGYANRIHKGETVFMNTSGIGSVLLLEIANYNKLLCSLSPDNLKYMNEKLQNSIYQCLHRLKNVSLINNSHGKMMFIAGLFNDEQNGTTEAQDIISYAVQINNELMVIGNELNLSFDLRYAITTGGPINCCIVLKGYGSMTATGEVIKKTHELIKYSNGGNVLLMDQTTIDCFYGQNGVAIKPSGEMKFLDAGQPFYSISFGSLSQ